MHCRRWVTSLFLAQICVLNFTQFSLFFTTSLGLCVSRGDAVAARIPAALTKNYSTCVCNLEQLGARREGSAATQSAISEACQACHWIHGRHFTGEYTLKHTQREVAGECQRWERRKAKPERESYYLCTNQQTISPPPSLSLCFGNRQRVGLRISWLRLAISAWLPTDWNTIKVKSQREKENQPAGTVMWAHARWHRRTNSMRTAQRFFFSAAVFMCTVSTIKISGVFPPTSKICKL